VRRERNLLRGIYAGVTAGLAASWVMNQFMAGPAQKLQQAVQSPEQTRQQQAQASAPQEDATMKAADEIVSTVTGGQQLSWEEKKKAEPVVHYAFGALVGGVYGGLAEYSRAVRAGLGTRFGSILFGGADLFAVPALGLSPSPKDQPASVLMSPFAAHMVYGVTTELVRRVVRAML
jgi:putative membrane protein